MPLQGKSEEQLKLFIIFIVYHNDRRRKKYHFVVNSIKKSHPLISYANLFMTPFIPLTLSLLAATSVVC